MRESGAACASWRESDRDGDAGIVRESHVQRVRAYWNFGNELNTPTNTQMNRNFIHVQRTLQSAIGEKLLDNARIPHTI